MKRKVNKRLMVLLLSVSLLLAASVSVTVAYILTQTGTITNIFAPSHVSCAVVQEGTSASVQNTGDIDVYIRVAIVVTWKNEAGEVYAQTPGAGDYSLAMSGSANWKKGSDGFWYYTKAVTPDEVTETLIASCEQQPGAQVPEGYSLCVEIIASAIQATSDAVGNWSNAVTAPSNGADLVIP